MRLNCQHMLQLVAGSSLAWDTSAGSSSDELHSSSSGRSAGMARVILSVIRQSSTGRSAVACCNVFHPGRLGNLPSNIILYGADLHPASIVQHLGLVHVFLDPLTAFELPRLVLVLGVPVISATVTPIRWGSSANRLQKVPCGFGSFYRVTAPFWSWGLAISWALSEKNCTFFAKKIEFLRIFEKIVPMFENFLKKPSHCSINSQKMLRNFSNNTQAYA